jgi:hypothetical protein
VQRWEGGQEEGNLWRERLRDELHRLAHLVLLEVLHPERVIVVLDRERCVTHTHTHTHTHTLDRQMY